MNVSFDNYISHRLFGVDNRLSMPQRSISFWAITVMAALVVLTGFERHTRTGEWYPALYGIAIAALSWGVFALLRIAVARLDATATELQRPMLRTISAHASRLVGLAEIGLMVLLMAK